MSDKKSELILVGKLTTPHGLNGAMKMICHSDNPIASKKAAWSSTPRAAVIPYFLPSRCRTACWCALKK